MITRPARVALALAIAVTGCARPRTELGPAPPPQPAATEAPPAPSVVVRDPALELRVARLELRLLERDAQIEELEARLDEARREVVRAMAKLQTLATRAEAASAMAEAEIALQAAHRGGSEVEPDAAESRQLLEMSAGEFGKQNYGGALYLANQAKSLAGPGRGRLVADPASLRPGEVPFAVPLRLQAVAQSNVREGPGTTFRVIFTVDKGAALVGHSSVGEWVRVSNGAGRAGWIHVSLVGRREGAR